MKRPEGKESSKKSKEKKVEIFQSKFFQRRELTESFDTWILSKFFFCAFMEDNNDTRLITITTKSKLKAKNFHRGLQFFRPSSGLIHGVAATSKETDWLTDRLLNAHGNDLR